MIELIDRTSYKFFGEVKEVSSVNYSVMKGVDKKLYFTWLLMNGSDQPAKVGFVIEPDNKAFRYDKRVLVKPYSTVNQRLAVNVEELADLWIGKILLSAEGKTKKIPVKFMKTVPYH